MASVPSIKVLIADDHEIVRRGLRQLLLEGWRGVVVGEARNGREAVDAVSRGRWDAVVLDIDMPGCSGMEALVEIKRVTPGLPVLMLSVHPEEEYAVSALKLGAAGYLNKVAAAEELLTALRQIVAGRRYVTPRLAEHLAATLGGKVGGETREALSAREMQVLCLVARGRSLKQVASELKLSEKTVGTYRSRIGEKLGLRTNVELTRYALRQGLVT